MPKTNPKMLTSAGLTRTLRKSLPVLVRPIYSYLLPQPHKDKIGTECLLLHCMGRKWPAEEVPEPGEDIMGPNWEKRKGVPEQREWEDGQETVEWVAVMDYLDTQFRGGTLRILYSKKLGPVSEYSCDCGLLKSFCNVV